MLKIYTSGNVNTFEGCFRALLEIPEKLRLGITTDNFLDCLKIIYLTENRKSPTKSYCLLSKELMLAFHRALFLGLYSFNKFT